MALKLECAAFGDGEEIPGKYTCDGENISPALSWSGVPKNTNSLALIFEDPDAPKKIWAHWILYNIPKDLRAIDEHISETAILLSGAIHGINDFGKFGYGGPCPPEEKHRYFLKLYALDELMRFKPGFKRNELLEAMEGHIIEEAQVMGVYQR